MPSTRKSMTSGTTKTKTNTKTATNKTAKAASKQKTTSTKATTNTKSTSTSTKTTIASLEKKVDILLDILESEFRGELRLGPKRVAERIRRAGLVVKE